MNFGSLRYLLSFTLMVFAEVETSTDSLISDVNLMMVLSMSVSVIVGSKSYLLVFMRSCLSNSVQSMVLIVLLKLFEFLVRIVMFGCGGHLIERVMARWSLWILSVISKLMIVLKSDDEAIVRSRIDW